jgi:hypothetical protein
MTHAQTHTHDDATAKPRKPQKNEDDIELFWLDFHDPDSGKFLGACLVPAERENFIEAVQVSHHYKCNPGGQVAWIEVENLHRAPREYLTRLLNADEVVKLMAIIRRAKLP